MKTGITITKPSGSGKSSVARAGLFHALRSGRLACNDLLVEDNRPPRKKRRDFRVVLIAPSD